MEVSVTMRPRRSFIMRFKQPFESRNTLVRLVAMTASQSSGFMRNSRLSRVIAALFTRIVGISPRVSRSPNSASIDAALETSSTAPRPLFPSHEVMPSAPAWDVAVPMTRAPAADSARAIPCPIPRKRR